MRYIIRILLLSSLMILLLFVFGCLKAENQEGTRYENLSHEIDKNLATPKNPVISPSAKYKLVIDKGYDGQVHFNQFKIVSNEKGLVGKILFKSAEKYRTCDTLFFLWDSEDRVWVYSGDVGTFYWLKESNSKWRKYSYGENGLSAPKLLKKLRPEYHQQ